MALTITDDCIACGVCVPECPNDAIAEGDPIFVINPDLCTECVPVHDTQQCQAVCPVECCLPDPEHQEAREDLEAKYNRIHT